MTSSSRIAIIGAGPAGLMAAEVLAQAGLTVDVYDRMPSPARKLLIAGRGGLNLTHSELLDTFLTRYGKASGWLEPAIRAFPPEALRAWCEGLGEDTFIGSSGRVFPRKMKASSLLRAWLLRLRKLGVRYHPRHNWAGWQGEALKFTTPEGDIHITPDATLLALGGASWPRLGSDGGWVSILASQGVAITPLAPANCGFIANWSEGFREQFAGQPLKPLSITHEGKTRQGEAMITAQGIEGGLAYALSSPIRDAITRDGKTTISLDLRPAMTHEALEKKLSAYGRRSLSTLLRSANFSPLSIALLHETIPGDISPISIAAKLKALPLTLTGTTSIERAISSAGGIQQSAVNEHYMLNALPGIFACGEMLDWEAPTGGYLLQACFSTGAAAARGILRHLGQ